MLMVNMSMLRYSMAPYMVARFGMMVGAIGALTLIPALAIAGLLFGLLQIIWFCWLGSLLLRGKLQSHSAYTASSSAMRGVNTTR